MSLDQVQDSYLNVHIAITLLEDALLTGDWVYWTTGINQDLAIFWSPNIQLLVSSPQHIAAHADVALSMLKNKLNSKSLIISYLK